MVVVMNQGATGEQVKVVEEKLARMKTAKGEEAV